MALSACGCFHGKNICLCVQVLQQKTAGIGFKTLTKQEGCATQVECEGCGRVMADMEKVLVWEPPSKLHRITNLHQALSMGSCAMSGPCGHSCSGEQKSKSRQSIFTEPNVLLVGLQCLQPSGGKVIKQKVPQLR